jgi:hypothetical protein
MTLTMTKSMRMKKRRRLAAEQRKRQLAAVKEA